MKKNKIIVYAAGIIFSSIITTLLLSLFEFKGRQPLSKEEIPIAFTISLITFTLGAIIHWLTRDY